jgi:DNA polymerase-1
MNKNTLILVDGSNYFYRAYHAMSSLSNSQGMPTGAIYGMTNMLKTLLHDYQPAYAAVTFDTKDKNFRHELYPNYKANRPPMPDDLVAQISSIHDMVQALGFPLLIKSGVEADDVIGTLAKQAEAAGMLALIFTGDKDFAQLVNASITLVDTMKKNTRSDTHLDAQGVQDKFGVPPQLIIDYLTLIGDKVDNIPGVKTVGPKTAVKWLNTYGNLDSVIKNAELIKGKVGENLRDALSHLPLTQQLLTIKCDVPLSHTPQQLKLNPPDIDKLRQLYTQLEFKKWLAELPPSQPTLRPHTALSTEDLHTAAPENASNFRPLSRKPPENRPVDDNGAMPKISPNSDTTWPPSEDKKSLSTEKARQQKFYTILSQTEFDDWLNRLVGAELFAFDTETTSLDYLEAQLVGISFAVQPGEAAYVPLTHDYLGAPAQLSRDKVLAALKPLLENPDKPKLGHNLKYDAHILANHGIQLQGIAFDSMLESYVLNSIATQHNLDALAKKYLGSQTTQFEDIAGKGKKQLSFNQIALEDAAPYACEDADMTLQLHQTLWQQLQTVASQKAAPKLGPISEPESVCNSEPEPVWNQRQVFTNIEMPLIPVLIRMERHGVKIDATQLHQHSAELAQSLQTLEKQAYDMAGSEFNLNSPKQLQTILFDKLGLPVLKKTPKKEPSTAVEVLEELALDYPLPQLILEYRSLSKLKSTYTDALPQQINPKTGRVHTSYQQAVATTGRLSSTNPNLQNIPIRTAEGRRIREVFIAPKGYRLLAADYSQIELRIMAHFSEDKKLLAAFAAGEDIHKFTAAEVFDVPLEDVTTEQRRSAKAVNFGLIYGMQAFGLAKQLGIERSEAQTYIDAYFNRYPGVKNYIEETRELAKQQGYVETLFGRRLYLPDIKSRNHQRRQYAERTAVNAPIQGSSADLIKLTMIEIDNKISQSGIEVKMLMQVHDELVFEIAEDALEDAKTAIIDAMTQIAELRVPLLVDIGVGNNWNEAH